MTDEEVKHLRFDFSWITLIYEYNILIIRIKDFSQL